MVVTPPALTEDSVLQFLLPSQYKDKNNIPEPDNLKITIQQLPERVVAVYPFAGVNSAERSDAKLKKLKAMLVRDGLLLNMQGQKPQEEMAGKGTAVVGEGIDSDLALSPAPAQDPSDLDLEHSLTWSVVEYHPSVTLPFLRRNEVWIELPVKSNGAVQQLLRHKRASDKSQSQPQAQPQPQHLKGKEKENGRGKGVRKEVLEIAESKDDDQGLEMEMPLDNEV